MTRVVWAWWPAISTFTSREAIFRGDIGDRGAVLAQVVGHQLQVGPGREIGCAGMSLSGHGHKQGDDGNG